MLHLYKDSGFYQLHWEEGRRYCSRAGKGHEAGIAGFMGMVAAHEVRRQNLMDIQEKGCVFYGG